MLRQKKNVLYIPTSAHQKQCKACGQHLSIEHYTCYAKSSDGLYPYCKACKRRGHRASRGRRTSGIYRLKSAVTDQAFYGTSTDIKRSKYDAWYHLRKGKHTCAGLQALYDKHGEDALVYTVLCVFHDDAPSTRRKMFRAVLKQMGVLCLNVKRDTHPLGCRE